MAFNQPIPSTGATFNLAISTTADYTVLSHKHKADVWTHYQLVRLSDGVEKSRHILCGDFFGSKGNTTLKRHHKKCELKLNPEGSQAQIDATRHTWIYDQVLQREMQMKCIISREWPFNHFDNEDSTSYKKQGLQPKYQKSFNRKTESLKPTISEVWICYKDHLAAAKRLQDQESAEDSSDDDDEVSLESENAGDT